MAAGRFECPCERQERVEETCLPSARMPRPWHWEDPSKPSYRGCSGPPSAKPVATFERRELFRCPSREVEPWAWDLMFLWRSWEQGALTDPGGVLDQMAPLLDAMRVIGAAVAKEQERQRDEALRRAEAESRAARAESRSRRR